MSLRFFVVLTVVVIAFSSVPTTTDAQSVRQQVLRDLSQVERVVVSRGDDFLLMGKGYLWDGLERVLLEKLKMRVRVRVLTGERDAPSFNALALAGAEVRTLPGSITQGPLLAGAVLIARRPSGEYVLIEADANAIIRARVMEVYSSTMTKAYAPR